MSASETLKQKPYYEKPRYPCPFYGFRTLASANMIVDQQKNQCALIMSSDLPCLMEESGLEPNWCNCRLKKDLGEEALARLRKENYAYPDEFRPPDTTGWCGMPFAEWMAYVLSADCPRPQNENKASVEQTARNYRDTLTKWVEEFKDATSDEVRTAVEKVREVIAIPDGGNFLYQARMAFLPFLDHTEPFSRNPTPLDQLHSIVNDISHFGVGW